MITKDPMQIATPVDGEQLRERLEAIARNHPDVAQMASLYRAILPILRGEGMPALPAPPPAEEVRAKLERGQPFLEGLALEIDVQQVTSLLVRLAAAAEMAGVRVSAEKMSLWLDEEYAGDRNAALQAILAGDSRQGLTGLERMGLDVDLFRFLAQTAMMPLLRSWRGQLALIAAEVHWDRGICYVCGSFPVFAELQGNDQEKHLRCGLCGADWRVRRLSCSHCGNEDHRSLRTLFPEQGHVGPRIEACGRCMTYLKAIPAFSPTPVDLLPVEDLATHYLDAAAARHGYQRAVDAA